jgi:hypothetical protein
MNQRGAIIALTILAAAAVWTVQSRKPLSNGSAELAQTPSTDPKTSRVVATKPPAAPETPPPAPDPEPEPEPPQPVIPPPKPVSIASTEETPPGPELGELDSGLTPATVLENLRGVFRQYILRFHENPVGDNAEITQALNGGNPKQVIFLQPDDGMRVNARGELVDNWGTPFFFHSLSRTEMEIRSAGPDHKMWTGDDLVMK